MSNDPHLDNPSIKLLETLRKRDKLQSPVGREAASFVEESEALIEEELLGSKVVTVPADPFDDLEDAANELEEKVPVEESSTEEKPVQTTSSELEETKIQTQFMNRSTVKKEAFLNRAVSYFKRWLKGEQNVIGIDISGNFIKIIRISNRMKGRVLTHCVACEIIGESGMKSSKDVANVIREIMAEKKFKNNSVVLSVSGPHTAIKQIVLPKLNKKEIIQAIQWQAKKNLPFPLESSQFDYIVHENENDKSEASPITLFAAENKYLDGTLALFEKSGIKISKVTAAPFALLDILKQNGMEDGESTFVIIDIGWDKMSITFVSAGMIQFIREVPVGVEELVEGLQGSITFRGKTANVSEIMAKRLIDKYGIPLELIDSYIDEDKEINSISQQMSGSVDRIVEEVLRSLNYFKKKFPEIDEPDILYISGHGADLYNMGLLLKRTTNKRIERINPLLGIEIDEDSVPPIMLNKIASSLSVAAGMARNFFEGPNIAPAAAKDDISFGVAKRLFAISAIILSIALSSFTFSVKWELDAKKQKALSKETDLASLSPIQQQFLTSSKEIGALRGLVQIMDKEEKKAEWLRSQLRVLSALSPPEMMLSHVDIRTTVSQADQNKGVPFVQLTGAIFADDFFSRQIIKDFHDSLLGTNLYANVEIIESNLAGSGGSRAMFFVINCFL